MKDVQCYELFGGIALKNHAFSFFFFISCYWSTLRMTSEKSFDGREVLSTRRLENGA